jgi:AmmeMemoRadiSam system protein A
MIEYIEKGKVICAPESLPQEFNKQAGVFVSLKKTGQLRGCIGTFSPTQPNLALEIIHNAISASTRDPRFAPVTADELAQIKISVDVLSEPAKVDNKDQLNSQRYGVIVTSGYKRGLLLPDLEGVNTVEEQLDIAKHKAGIKSGENIEIMRFEVQRFKEP